MRQMKNLKNIIYCLIPILVGIILSLGLNFFLDKKIDELIHNKDLSIIKKSVGNIHKDKGVIFNEYCIKSNDVLLQGSSELGSQVPQAPKKFFPIQDLKDDVTTFGRAYVQNLHHSSIIGSQTIDKRKNVALILSLQWFYNEKGIKPKDFEANFAPVQFYKYLENKKISEQNKKKYAKRVYEALEGSSQFCPERIYAKHYISTNTIEKTMFYVFKPYFSMRKYIVRLKDKGLLYKNLRRLPENKEIRRREVDWKNEYIKAEKEGNLKVTNNKFMIEDSYFNKYIKDNLDKYQGINSKINLINSKEYEDYELYLDTCKELGIKPYIILMPTNGFWYDYTGVKRENRIEFYNRVEKMAKDRGFEVLQLKDNEYTQYFMYDCMHLGWKGWLEVDEEIYKHFKK